MRLTRCHVDVALATDAEVPARSPLPSTWSACCVCAKAKARAVQWRRQRPRARITMPASARSRPGRVGRAVENESPLRITLLQGIARGERWT